VSTKIPREYTIGGTLLLVFILLTVPANIRLGRMANQPLPPSLWSAGDGEGDNLAGSFVMLTPQTRLGKTVIPDDPGRYKIGVRGESDTRADSARWDHDLQAVVSQPRVLSDLEKEGAFQGIRLDIPAFKRRARILRAQIARYENLVRQDPNDSDAQRILQNLYKLKSSLKVMEDAMSKR